MIFGEAAVAQMLVLGEWFEKFLLTFLCMLLECLFPNCKGVKDGGNCSQREQISGDAPFYQFPKKKNLLERNHSLPIVSPSGWLVLHVHAFYGKDKKNIQEFFSCLGKNSALHISRNKRKREHPCNLIVTFAIFF